MVSSPGTRTCPQTAGCVHHTHYCHFDLGETSHRERGYPDLQTLLHRERKGRGTGEKTRSKEAVIRRDKSLNSHTSLADLNSVRDQNYYCVPNGSMLKWVSKRYLVTPCMKEEEFCHAEFILQKCWEIKWNSINVTKNNEWTKAEKHREFGYGVFN